MSISGKDIDNLPEKREIEVPGFGKTVAKTEASGVPNISKGHQHATSSSDRQLKFERAQKCLENAAIVSKRIKEHRKATAELLGRPFEEDEIPDTTSEMASTISERTGYSAATDTSTTLSVQEALNSDAMQLQQSLKEKENALSIMQVKMKAMETTILELQEKINEKDMIIEAKTKATALMSDSISKKEKDSLLLLEDTRQQMSKMQENFISMELEWKEEKQKLIVELEQKTEKIKHLEEANTVLENSRFEISLTHSKLVEELDEKNKFILELQEQIDELSKTSEQLCMPEPKIFEAIGVEKGSLEIEKMVEMSNKIEVLEKLNCQIRQTNKELEYKINQLNQESKLVPTLSTKKTSPGSNRKGGRNSSSKVKSPWSTQMETTQDQDKKQTKHEDVDLNIVLQSLNKDLLDKEFEISQKDSLIEELQKQIKEKSDIVKELEQTITEVKKDHNSKTADVQYVECNKEETVKDSVDITQENIISTSVDLENELKVAQEQINLLNNEIDVSNKNMIKVKSAHKVKIKQMQKTIDNFSKISDVNAEIVKLNEEVHQLTQKVAELEEEKGNLQLHLVDYDSGRLTESETYKKMIEMESLAESRLKAISILEAQKFDLVQELHLLKVKNVEMEDKLTDLSHLQNEQVCSEMKLVQLEEQIDEITSQKLDLEVVIQNLKEGKEELESNLMHSQQEKEQMSHKLEQYIQENMDLTDKLEKLSAEKVSSAESIEIVESLTTQEKLELEEYNKTILKKNDDSHIGESQISPQDFTESVQKLTEESAELNKKIELFTQERQEVMEKMSKINNANEELQNKIIDLNNTICTLQNTIDLLKHEKVQTEVLNEELSNQIEELKRERLELMKENTTLNKQLPIDDSIENINVDNPQEDKTILEKVPKTKSFKQFTKEILKLKNTIKEREDEIADCQMKILSLEEQHQKFEDLMLTNQTYETKIKVLAEEKNRLEEELLNIKEHKEAENLAIKSEKNDAIKQYNDNLQLEINRIQNEYQSALLTRDVRIQELEQLLNEYETQIQNYNSTLQHKDKEMTEYINQVTKLNDVSQKLKSTIEVLEEEKANDQNVELIKSLNKQISMYQKSLVEQEEKLKILDEEKLQLQSAKATLKTKNANLELQLKNLNEDLIEKQSLIKDLQLQKQKHDEEISTIKSEVKEKDEEIHEIKLQLRKESIENEKLHTNLIESTKNINENAQIVNELRDEIQQLTLEKEKVSNEVVATETKNKELMEKLKKFAVSLKKKNNAYADLEKQMATLQDDLTLKIKELDDVSRDVSNITSLKENVSYLEEELCRVRKESSTSENEKASNILQLQSQVALLEEQLQSSKAQIEVMMETNTIVNVKLRDNIQENKDLKDEVLALNHKIAKFEVEIKNSTNLETKISSLESDVYQKQEYIDELLNTIDDLKSNQNGYDAKIQECRMYIEHLENEISKYKNRIFRLEESISAMENRRHSLERKADQLDSQLQEKHKAYSEYINQEDELVNRIAMLMEHDNVVEKQLREIESENKDLQIKNQNLTEDNQKLQKRVFEIQEELNIIREKANKGEIVEIELNACQNKLKDLESRMKKVVVDHQVAILKKSEQIDELEMEFNNQIESSLKEKKSLSERCEKMTENMLQLEQKLQEYASNIHTLTANLNETSQENQELRTKLNSEERKQLNDYTEQYVSEINRLQSSINEKNSFITNLENKLKVSQLDSTNIINGLENEITELNTKASITLSKIETLTTELTNAKYENENLQAVVKQKEEEIKQVMEQKSVTFEMTIPKTEGMVISSTIEELRDEPSQKYITDLESQIISDNPEKSTFVESEQMIRAFEHTEYKASPNDNLESEHLIVPKKAYLCYKESDDENKPMIDIKDSDVFHSDEGWGFQEMSVDNEVIPGLSHLQEEIGKLNAVNNDLKSELNIANNKLMKALKKIKEMKMTHDILSNELKLSKQLSQSTLLDTAIEDELNNQIKELTDKINNLQTELMKERREKDSLRKQSEVFGNANDRLTEMKEKLDSEIELWKFKFKEVNDKLSALQWGTEQIEATNVSSFAEDSVKKNYNNEDHEKLEKENEELHVIVEQLRNQNNELVTAQSELKNTLNDLSENARQIQQCDSCEQSSSKIKELSELNSKIVSENNNLTEKLLEIEETYRVIKEKYDAILQDNEKLNTLYKKDRESVDEKHEESLLQLNNAKDKILGLESALQEALDKLLTYEAKSSEMTAKIENLDAENDQLLSTVAELRSSISSAIDQRGYEIAEMWKQHLSQREADFAKVEQDLRAELSAFESKYEQLLDNVQSSNQDETNKLVIIEQLNTLQNKLRDKEEHFVNLQSKYSNIISEMDMLRSEMEDEKILHENKVLGQQEDYEKQISELTSKIEQEQSTREQTVSDLNEELMTARKNHKQLLDEIDGLKLQLMEMENKIVHFNNEIRMKDSEIYQKTHEYTLALTQRNEDFENVRKQLLDYEKKIEELTYEKESELAVLRLKMHEQSTYFQSAKEVLEKEKVELSDLLNEKILECGKLNKEIIDLNKTLEEYKNKISEMQIALENQEIEIVSLNDEVNKLQSLLRASTNKVDKHVTFASDTKPGSDHVQSDAVLNKELLDPVPRAELDLALYMLHQRDVRCEELTMELTQLLDERDTLQIRLSDSLRSCEELKKKCKSAGYDVSFSSNSSLDALPESPNVSGEQFFVDTHKPQTSRSSSISDIDTEKPKLQAKLSELRTVRHSRDVRLRQDSEQRQLGMRLLHRDVANLPPEAADQLRQAHHTLWQIDGLTCSPTHERSGLK
ncbi:Protein lava lamp [Eumeta japonica]|uniref:Protein lava lamp n=1 Tax=Eumeta variegata TaxID=151549 RepID=A0A4C1TSQ2_EUMVA|nr:Protein lava lamp [Eumeta japonica]